jgi:hypothetical protein
MSIAQMIRWRIAEGMLYELQPRFTNASSVRRILIAETAWSVIQNPPADQTQRYAELEADLAQFVDSPTLNPQYIFMLTPARDCVWEIRSVMPQPQIRALGLFAAFNTFVVTHLSLRSALGTEWNSRPWKETKRLARAQWRVLFHSYAPLPGRDVNSLFSGAINGEYFKSPKPPK